MTYKEARVYLDEVSKYGSVLGLDTIRGLLHELGDPQADLKFIHIAGTNGKGSILAFLSNIWSEAGFRVGRYISPTVVSYLEKIQIDGKWIPEEEFTELVDKVQKAVVRMETDGKGCPTVFEIETAIAFLYFQKMHCDLVVLETGMGGSLDATNIVENTAIAVFASISRDHIGILGNTIEEIAQNKAGIIKPGCVVVSAAQEPEVQRVLEARAEKYGCPILFAEPEKAVVTEEDCRGQIFSYKEMKEIKIRLAGRYQILNAVTVCEAVWAWNQYCGGKPVTAQAAYDGFEKTVWPGRFTCISGSPVFIVDGAHNADAAKRLRETIEQYFPGKKMIYIIGVFKDKEYERIAEIMAPLARSIYTIDLPNRERTLDAEELRHVLQRYCTAVPVSQECCLPGGPSPAARVRSSDGAQEAAVVQMTDGVQEEARVRPSDGAQEAAVVRMVDGVQEAAHVRPSDGVQEAGGARETGSEQTACIVQAAGSIEAAVDAAWSEAGPDDVILAFGSLSYLGRVMELVEKKSKDCP